MAIAQPGIGVFGGFLGPASNASGPMGVRGLMWAGLAMAAALAGELELSEGRLLWMDGGHAAVIDPRSGALLDGGPRERFERSDAPVDPGLEAVRLEVGEDGIALSVGGRERWRVGTPSDLRVVRSRVAFDRENAVLWDGRRAVLVRGGRVSVHRVEGRGAVLYDGTYAAFAGRPDRVMHVASERILPVPRQRYEPEVRLERGLAVGGTGGRAVVWDGEGHLRFVAPEPDLGQRRVGPDGEQLGVVHYDPGGGRRGRLYGVGTAQVLVDREACAAGDRIWPVGAGVFLDVCAERDETELWLRSASWERRVAVLPEATEVRFVQPRPPILRVVTGDGARGVDVWSVPLGGGEPTRQSGFDDPTGVAEVEGWEAGVRKPLEVRLVQGRPVEIHTARAYERMRRAAARDGVRIAIGSGFRTYAEQEVLYGCYLSGDCNGGNLAARPGYSNHQSGRALDLNTLDRGVLRWLRRNGPKHGFRATVRGEPWHWEYTGPGERSPTPVAVLPPALPEWLAPDLPWAEPG